jgi:biopolymer transport protein ExbD
MGAVDLGGAKKAAGGPSWKRPRVNIRIDMTPMVDIAFLLLIFFMVTTVFRTPQALEINLPPDKEAKVNVAQSKVLTFRVLPDRAYWKHGTDPWARTNVSDIAKVLKQWAADKDVIVLVEIDRDAKFNSMVKIIDDLDLAKMTRFSLNTLKPEERKEVEAL